MHESDSQNASSPPRRNFLKQFVTGVIGVVVGIIPGLAGLAVVFDPLKRKSSEPGGALLVAKLGSLPADNVPRRFQVFSDRVDAWNTYKNIPVGAVYLRRSTDNQVSALNAACPHAGCSVAYLKDKEEFRCPCHDSLFEVNGQIANTTSPSPRAMDALEVELRNENEVWVKFRNFQPGHKEQLPVA